MKFVDESGRFASTLNCPFGRQGSYFYVRADLTEQFGRAYAYLCTCHGAAGALGKNKLFALIPLYEGERVPYAIIMKPTELTLRTLYGDIKMCIAEDKLMLFKGENHLGLRLSTTGEELDRITKPRGKTGWETIFSWVMTTVAHPIKGSITATAPWEWDRNRCGHCNIDFLPDEDGIMVASLEEFRHSGYVRENYPSYEEGLANATCAWETFLNNIPKLPGKYEKLREIAAYNLWSYTVGAEGLIKHPMLFMGRTGPTSQWQTTFQTLAFGNNKDLGWAQMLVSFDQQSPTGQLPDFYDDSRGSFMCTRPPIHGWALKQMRKLGYYDKLSKEELKEFYPKLEAWANWFGKYRTDGVDGLPHYEHPDESGMEDGSTFRESNIMVTPDLPAYLVLLFEELGNMSQDIGMEPAIKEAWYKRAREMQERLIEKLWTGERFVSHTLDGKEIARDYGTLGYMPIVLGHRLPEEILKKLVDDLKIEGYILSDYGFDKEKMIARELSDIAHNSVRGMIYHPFQVIMLSSLIDMGEEEFAHMVAKRYCDAMVDGPGLSDGLNAFTGATPGYGISWTAGAYLLIAGMTE